MKFSIALCILVVCITYTANSVEGQGCDSYGHSCHGGHGRSENNEQDPLPDCCVNATESNDESREESPVSRPYE
uniref:U7-Sparatoxin-Hju1e_2 n=1 Tax=Heteropoda jugulans TaxID=1358901 RepID=A0A4Q8KDI7_9ARAC